MNEMFLLTLLYLLPAGYCFWLFWRRRPYTCWVHGKHYTVLPDRKWVVVALGFLMMLYVITMTELFARFDLRLQITFLFAALCVVFMGSRFSKKEQRSWQGKRARSLR